MDSASFKIKRFIQHCYCLVSNHATLHEAELIIKFSALHSPWSLEEKAFLQGIFSCIKIELTGTVNFPTISKPVHLGEDLCKKSQNSNHRTVANKEHKTCIFSCQFQSCRTALTIEINTTTLFYEYINAKIILMKMRRARVVLASEFPLALWNKRAALRVYAKQLKKNQSKSKELKLKQIKAMNY